MTGGWYNGDGTPDNGKVGEDPIKVAAQEMQITTAAYAQQKVELAKSGLGALIGGGAPSPEAMATAMRNGGSLPQSHDPYAGLTRDEKIALIGQLQKSKAAKQAASVADDNTDLVDPIEELSKGSKVQKHLGPASEDSTHPQVHNASDKTGISEEEADDEAVDGEGRGKTTPLEAPKKGELRKSADTALQVFNLATNEDDLRKSFAVLHRAMNTEASRFEGTIVEKEALDATIEYKKALLAARKEKLDEASGRTRWQKIDAIRDAYYDQLDALEVKVLEHQRKLMDLQKSEIGMADLFGDLLIKSSGEGSRGGHIVGHTASGEPIYASSKGSAESKHHEVEIYSDSRGHAGKGVTSTKWTIHDPSKPGGKEYHEYETKGASPAERKKAALEAHGKKHGITKPVKEVRSFAERDRKAKTAGVSQGTDPKKVTIAAASGAKELDASHTAGHYSVHASETGSGHTVTHRPSGLALKEFSNKKEAASFADHMHQEAGDAGKDLKFGKAPGKKDREHLERIHGAMGSFKKSEHVSALADFLRKSEAQGKAMENANDILHDFILKSDGQGGLPATGVPPGLPSSLRPEDGGTVAGVGAPTGAQSPPEAGVAATAGNPGTGGDQDLQAETPSEEDLEKEAGGQKLSKSSDAQWVDWDQAKDDGEYLRAQLTSQLLNKSLDVSIGLGVKARRAEEAPVERRLPNVVFQKGGMVVYVDSEDQKIEKAMERAGGHLVFNQGSQANVGAPIHNSIECGCGALVKSYLSSCTECGASLHGVSLPESQGLRLSKSVASALLPGEEDDILIG